jgi:hypothetical protein
MSRENNTSRFQVYSLSGLLPQGDTLVLNHALRVLTQVTAHGDLVEQCRLSPDTVEMLEVLLAAVPRYCSDAVLLAAKTGESEERCAQQLRWAKEAGDPLVYDTLMRPVRGTISRLRERLQRFRIDLRALIGTGYLLIALSPAMARITQEDKNHDEEEDQEL